MIPCNTEGFSNETPPYKSKIMEITNGIWNQSANDCQTPNVAWLQRQCQGNSCPPTGLERLCKRAAARENEVIEQEEVRQRQASSTPIAHRNQLGMPLIPGHLSGLTLFSMLCTSFSVTVWHISSSSTALVAKSWSVISVRSALTVGQNCSASALNS